MADVVATTIVADRVANPVGEAAMMSPILLTHGLGHLPGLTHELRLVVAGRRHVLRLSGSTVGVPAMAGVPRGAGAKAARVLWMGLITAAGSAAAIACGPRARASQIPRLRHVLAPPLRELLRLLQGLLRVLRLCAGCGLAPALPAIATASGDAGIDIARAGCCEEQAREQGALVRHRWVMRNIRER